MELNVVRIYRWLTGRLNKSTPMEEGMIGLIDRCEKDLPHPDWEKLRQLNYADLSAMQAWLETALRNEPPKAPLKGLWFGLFNPCDDQGNPTADIYVSGSERDPDPEDNEWACNPEWWPESRYCKSTVLAEIYRIAYGNAPEDEDSSDRLGINAEYFLCLGHGAFAVKTLLPQMDPSLVLGKSESLGVAVGFDSGDFILLGKLGPNGWLQ